MNIASTHFIKDNFFCTLRNEILFNIIKHYPQHLLNVNKEMLTISKTCFQQFNEEILQSCPSLKGIYEKKKGDTRSLKLFLRLIHHIHDLAKDNSYDMASFSSQAKRPDIGSTNYFEKLPNEMLYQIVQYCPEKMLYVNKFLNTISNYFFQEYNKEIIISYPALKDIYEAKKETTGSVTLFMQLINNLHDKAKELRCESKAPSTENRMEWESKNFRFLAKKIELADRIHAPLRAHDFKVFVHEVGKAAEVNLNLKKIKMGDLGKSDWKVPDDKNRQVWTNFLRHSRPVDLKSLNLQFYLDSDSCLSFIPAEIGQLTTLQTLAIQGSYIRGLPYEISFLKNLKSLTINLNNNLKKFPLSICKLSQLQELHINRNANLKELPPEIGQLKNLKVLKCRANDLQKIPAEIAQLTQLVELDISHNYLKTFPIDICLLSQLTKLNLSYTNLKKIPSEIRQLKQLKELVLAHTHSSCSWQNFTEICELPELESVDFYGSGLTSIPSNISKLGNLITLNLNTNPLKKFPEELYALSRLEILKLNNVQLTTIPPAINKLLRLKELDIGNNFFKRIPEEITELPLKILHIKNINPRMSLQMKDLPSSVQNLSKGRKLDLRLNPEFGI